MAFQSQCSAPLLKPLLAQVSASPSLNRCRLQICLTPICSLHKLVISGHISFFILLASCLMTFFVPPILVYVRGVADFTDFFYVIASSNGNLSNGRFVKWKFKPVYDLVRNLYILVCVVTLSSK
uniref:Uncharacterized protein n=1 Tax=Aegilops tauschii subsp. strangulata TaxID=200361 RepID=A0A453M0J1_AEGTS